MVPNEIERETIIDAPVERVWELLSEAEHVGRWFSDAGAEIDLRPGGAMLLRWAEHGEFHARVEEVEPHRVFAFRGARDPGKTQFGDGNSTLVRFTLSPEGGTTRLRVVESGFAGLDGSKEERARYVEGNRRGWEIEFGHLEDYARRVQV